MRTMRISALLLGSSLIVFLATTSVLVSGQGGGAPALNTFAIQQAVAKEWGVTTEGLRSKTAAR